MSETAGANPPQTDELTEEVGKIVTDCIVDLGEVDRTNVTLSASLEALDIDSLDLVEIAQVLEERFGIVIEQTDMKDVTTVGDAIDAIVARIEK